MILTQFYYRQRISTGLLELHAQQFVQMYQAKLENTLTGLNEQIRCTGRDIEEIKSNISSMEEKITYISNNYLKYKTLSEQINQEVSGINKESVTASKGEECITCYNDFFEGCEAKVNVYVPDSKVDVYKIISETWNTVDVQVFPLSDKQEKLLYGDVDYDGTVSLSDIIMLQKGLVNIGSVKVWKAGDLDNNDIINVFDLILMKRMITK